MTVRSADGWEWPEVVIPEEEEHVEENTFVHRADTRTVKGCSFICSCCKGELQRRANKLKEDAKVLKEQGRLKKRRH
jgi:hypothetical protein